MLKGKDPVRNICAMIFLLALWQVFSVLSKLPFVPSPMAVLINVNNIFLDKMVIHALYSLWRIFAGILCSIAFGTPLGILMGYFKPLDRFLSPVVYLTYPIPKIALIPLTMLFLGLGEASKIFMISLIAVFQVIVSSRDAVKGIPNETYYSLYSLGAKEFDIFKRVVIPAALPALLTSLRICLGTALSVLFFTETFGTQYGMGYFIMDSWMRINYVDMYSGIFVLSLIGFLLFLLIDILEGILCSWKS